MKNLAVSLSLALAFLSFEPYSPQKGIDASKHCICSFLTVSSSCESDNDSGEDKALQVEYSCKIYEWIVEFFK